MHGEERKCGRGNYRIGCSGEANLDCHGEPWSFRSRPLVARQRGGKGFARSVQSNAGGTSEEGEESRLGNGHIEASHRSSRWIRVIGTHPAPRRSVGETS